MLGPSQSFTLPIAGSDLIPAHTVTCYSWGNPQATDTVLCAHGLTRNGRDFDFLAQALAAGCRVLCPDFAGRGQSPFLTNPTGYHYGTYVASIVQLLAAQHVTSVSWVGTSMGGIVGMMLANAMPGLIRSLVINDIGCLIPAAGLRRISAYAASNKNFPSRAAAEAALRQNCATFGIKEETHWQHFFAHSIVVNPDGTARLAYDPAIMDSLPKGDDIQDVNLWGLWEAVTKIPVLLIRGAQSDILTRETAMDMQSKHPRLTMHEIMDAGHAPALMDATQIDLIKNWIS